MLQYPKQFRRVPVRSVEQQGPGRSLVGDRTSLGSNFGSPARLQQPQGVTRVEPFERRIEPTKAIQHPHNGGTASLVESETPQTVQSQSEADSTGNWQAIAMELQADMESFRRRQLRRAEAVAGQEQERLLRLMLPVIDNLERALNYQDVADHKLRQGVELTYREFVRLLAAEGVTKFDSVGQPFDPNLHDALATQPHQGEPNTVVDEIEAGYKLNDKLLRPAKVIVAA